MQQPNSKYLRSYAYQFKDREVQTPMTYTMTQNGDNTVTLTPSTGTVTEEGTPITGSIMNDNLQGGLLDLIFPIGRGFIDYTDYDYSNYLGFTWELTLMDMYPIGYNPSGNNEIGDTVGSNSLSIAKANLPNYTLYNETHSHQYADDATTNAAGLKTDGDAVNKGQVKLLSSAKRATDSTRITVNLGGEGKPLDNRPNSKVVAYWVRVA